MTLYLKPTGAGHASGEPFAISAEAGSVMVGRHESSDLRVAQAAVSANHAKLEILDDSSIEVTDCDSSHGTFVNDERVSTGIISAGDRIRFATAEFELASGSNGDTPFSDESALETRAIPPISEMKRQGETISEMGGRLSERDAEIEQLRNLLASVERERDTAIELQKTSEAALNALGEQAKRDLEEEIESKKLELIHVSTDLDKLRREVEEEVRKSQKLSRRYSASGETGKISPASIALDAEQEVYRSLIGRIEIFDKMIEGYRRSRKFSEIVGELTDFREKLASILSENGVEPFEIEVGTTLHPKHRREVQILERKGWGTRKYIERQFRPGEVSQVVRQGYRVGSAILRKVEVLINEAEG